jgi:hypothetical protein
MTSLSSIRTLALLISFEKTHHLFLSCPFLWRAMARHESPIVVSIYTLQIIQTETVQIERHTKCIHHLNAYTWTERTKKSVCRKIPNLMSRTGDWGERERTHTASQVHMLRETNWKVRQSVNNMTDVTERQCNKTWRPGAEIITSGSSSRGSLRNMCCHKSHVLCGTVRI